MKKEKLSVLHLFIVALLLLSLVCGCSNEQTPPTADDTSTYVTDRVTPEADSQTEPEEPESLAAPIESTPLNSDLEIITRANHPTYYGSIEQAHIIWDDDASSKKVAFKSSSYVLNQTILSMSAYSNSDLIRGIEVYFENFENPVNSAIEEVLPIVASYVPFDILEKYYEFSESQIITPNSDNDEKKIYYIIRYSLSEEGSSLQHEYSGSMDIIIETDENGKVNNFSIRFGLPRWMSSLELNGYHSDSWSVNLNDYR